MDLTTIFNNLNDSLDEALLKADKLNDLQHSPGEDILSVKIKALTKYQSQLLKIKKFQATNRDKSLKEIEDEIFESTVQRTILERIRPLELKIQPKIDVMIKTIKEGGISKNDPINLKPNLLNDLDSDQQSGSDDDNNSNNDKSSDIEDDIKDDQISSEENEPKSSKQIYKPPQIRAVHYPGDKSEKSEIKLQKSKERALQSSLIKELALETGDMPEEISNKGTVNSFRNNKILKKAKERRENDEEYYVRTAISKKQKRLEKQALTKDEFESITSFGDISVLDSSRVKEYLKSRGKKKSFRGRKKKR